MKLTSVDNTLLLKQKSKSNLFFTYYKHHYLFLMLLPALIHFFVFRYMPIYGAQIAFKDFYPLKGIWESEWVGLDHFIAMFKGRYFLPVLRNTLLISTYKLLVGFPAPIILAIMLNEVRKMHFKKVIQTISYLPHFISWVVLAGIVIEFLSPSRGPINIILQSLGFKPIFFVAEEAWFRSVLVVSSVWKEIGWGSIIYLAAVTNIDPALYEVADIDGAGRLRKIWNVTIPGLMPVMIIMFIFAIGKIITDDFDQIYNLYNINVYSVGDVISTYTYREGLGHMNYSYSTAVGLFKNVISFSLVLSTNYIARRVNEHALF